MKPTRPIPPRPKLETTPMVRKIAADLVAGSIAATLAERGGRYGDFTDNARISQALLATCREQAPHAWPALDDVKREALTVIMAKVARILNGNPNYKDNWHDIAGYAKLAEDRCSDG